MPRSNLNVAEPWSPGERWGVSGVEVLFFTEQSDVARLVEEATLFLGRELHQARACGGCRLPA
jgi:hypothetical protein